MPHIKDYTGKRAHMIGIGGSSMSGLAGMLVMIFGYRMKEARLAEMIEEINARKAAEAPAEVPKA